VVEDLARERFAGTRAVMLKRPSVARDLEATRAALADLAALTEKIVIISNTEGGTAALLARLGIYQLGPGDGVPVSLIVDSSEVGVHKPDPEIYRYAARKIGVAPEGCLHVGGSVRNDVVAATAGAALHFCPYGDCRDAAHGHVRSFSSALREVLYFVDSLVSTPIRSPVARTSMTARPRSSFEHIACVHLS
jgi:HAD superfamily hydrolase (TIGR01549 family)